MGDIFCVAKISNIFLGCLKFLIFFGVNGSLRMSKKSKYPPPPPPPPGPTLNANLVAL